MSAAESVQIATHLAVAPRAVRDDGSIVLSPPVVPLPVLLAAVAALQAAKEADAATAFTLPTPLYMQLIKATSGLAYYTDRIVAERFVEVQA